jgi:hypothetical protein
MNCPKCDGTLILKTNWDEWSNGQLYEYNYLKCDKCGHVIYDSEEEFEYPLDDPLI